MAEKRHSSVPFFIVFAFYLLAISSEAARSRNPSSNLQAAAVRRRAAVESPFRASELWCVAKNNAEDAALQSALDWACGAGGADCSAIQQGGPCFEPQDIQSYASYAFNDYFLKNGLGKGSCDFGGSAALTSLNPSHGNCHFPSSSSARNGSFVGLTSGTITGMEPAGADTSNGQVARVWALPLLSAILLLMNALTFQ